MKSFVAVVILLFSTFTFVNGQQNCQLQELMNRYNSNKEKWEPYYRNKLIKAVKKNYTKNHKYYTKYWEFNTKDSLPKIVRESRFIYLPLYTITYCEQEDMCSKTVSQLLSMLEFSEKEPLRSAAMVYNGFVIASGVDKIGQPNKPYVAPPNSMEKEGSYHYEDLLPDYAFKIRSKTGDDKLSLFLSSTIWYIKGDSLKAYNYVDEKTYNAEEYIKMICKSGNVTNVALLNFLECNPSVGTCSPGVTYYKDL